jgi:hypothetical protein
MITILPEFPPYRKIPPKIPDWFLTLAEKNFGVDNAGIFWGTGF